MANGRNLRARRDTGREPGGFVALPWTVLDSAAYMGLSHTAKALLLELARQYRGSDNGRLLLSGKYLATRGWRAPSVIQRAKKELIDAELIFETVHGHRPNKASWYAVTWRNLDRIAGYDVGIERAFVRGAYRLKEPLKPSKENAAFTTREIIERPSIATSEVIGKRPATTPKIAIKPVLPPSPTTSEIVPLDVPSPGFVGEAVRSEGKKAKTCRHPGCETLTMGRDFCSRHRLQVSPNATAAWEPKAIAQRAGRVRIHGAALRSALMESFR